MGGVCGAGDGRGEHILVTVVFGRGVGGDWCAEDELKVKWQSSKSANFSVVN